ncbi:MAG: Uncharacterised protein [Rhodobiaceae bacterium UBA7378]|nr:MAG: Uncharacterised protein [Rhodobiaceae bacterium UBA7378]|tara:strand:+ start:446 stop:727 length:282 start_codon:yes stop_codon:yes gene_type:complete
MTLLRDAYAAETGALETALAAGDFDTALACDQRRQDLLRTAITEMPENDDDLQRFLADAEAHNAEMIDRLEEGLMQGRRALAQSQKAMKAYTL